MDKEGAHGGEALGGSGRIQGAGALAANALAGGRVLVEPPPNLIRPAVDAREHHAVEDKHVWVREARRRRRL